jgi:hypothetical protein
MNNLQVMIIAKGEIKKNKKIKKWLYNNRTVVKQVSY